MKKQFLILATITTMVFISCSKEKIETQQPGIAEEIATKKGGGGNPSVYLNKGLLGWYRFDGNLMESTGSLGNGVTGPVDGADIYMDDRKGITNSAIKFNGRYLVYINNVPHSTEMSIAAWVKYDSASAAASAFIDSQSDGPMFIQAFNQYYGLNGGVSWVPSGAIDDHWHHLVTTTDGTIVKFYVDGKFVGNVTSPDFEPDGLYYYTLGFGNVQFQNWHGGVDDLRFYGRTLSDTEIQALYSL